MLITINCFNLPLCLVNILVFFLKVIEGFGVAKVLASDHPSFKSGDFVSGLTGWEEYSLIQKPDQLRKIQSEDLPLSYHVGLLGMDFFFINFLHIN